MTIVDFHNHYYPPEYIKQLKGGQSRITVTFDAEENPVLHSPGDVNIVVPGHRDINVRQEVLDTAGIDMQVLTLTTPGTLIEMPERGVQLAQIVNDALAKIVSDRGNRFTALATLPLTDPEASLREFERVVQLGFPGCMLFGNVNGVPLADERFWPLYERASDAKTVMFIHPTYPVGVESMTDYWLMPLVGFLFDTTLAAAHLVYSGVVERFPGIRWVLGHLGGAIPYMAERLDRGYYAFADCRQHISKPPTEYLKEFYYDTVNFDVSALQLALDFTGPEHIVAGSDYPHQIGSLERMLQSIEQLEISADQKTGILGANAVRLLGL